MAQLQKVEGQVELKTEAHKFFDVWACNPNLLPKICACKIDKVELIDGEWHKAGSLLNWTYLIKEDGIGDRTLKLTTKVEELDVKKMKMRYGYPGGCIMKSYYKCLKSKLEVAPKCHGHQGKQGSGSNSGSGCIVKWSMEYEKMNEAVPEATIYIDYLLDLAKEIDTYCASNNNA